MIVHISDRSKFKRSHSYARKMLYTSSVFGATYQDFLRIKGDPRLKSKYVVWYEDPSRKNKPKK